MADKVDPIFNKTPQGKNPKNKQMKFGENANQKPGTANNPENENPNPNPNPQQGNR